MMRNLLLIVLAVSSVAAGIWYVNNHSREKPGEPGGLVGMAAPQRRPASQQASTRKPAGAAGDVEQKGKIVEARTRANEARKIEQPGPRPEDDPRVEAARLEAEGIRKMEQTRAQAEEERVEEARLQADDARKVEEAKLKADDSRKIEQVAEARVRDNVERLRQYVDDVRKIERSRAEEAKSAERAQIVTTASAGVARANVEAARAALAQQEAFLAEIEKARMASQRTENPAMRDKLLVELNTILETRDSARGLIVNMSDVLFDVNQTGLKPGAREKLTRVSGILQSYPGLKMAIEGHTDSMGPDEYNLTLSEKRAASVRDFLVKAGIGSQNLSAMGLGKLNPIASNDTAAGRQQNRRVELVISGDPIGAPSAVRAGH